MTSMTNKYATSSEIKELGNLLLKGADLIGSQELFADKICEKQPFINQVINGKKSNIKRSRYYTISGNAKEVINRTTRRNQFGSFVVDKLLHEMNNGQPPFIYAKNLCSEIASWAISCTTKRLEWWNTGIYPKVWMAKSASGYHDYYPLIALKLSGSWPMDLSGVNQIIEDLTLFAIEQIENGWVIKNTQEKINKKGTNVVSAALYNNYAISLYMSNKNSFYSGSEEPHAKSVKRYLQEAMKASYMNAIARTSLTVADKIHDLMWAKKILAITRKHNDGKMPRNILADIENQDEFKFLKKSQIFK